MKNWYKLGKFARPGPDGPDAPRIQPKNTELPPYSPGYALKKYALAKKQYLAVPRDQSSQVSYW
eukprot:SAG11_NODE_1567_length_4672_cov_13.208834_4_plen_64_part_00